ncbi:MAG: hypothetical protein HQK57_07470 [Deltaproteobacteria bacterium]|nr:hypothetical protein [Deltaproteobacteria bacterium]
MFKRRPLIEIMRIIRSKLAHLSDSGFFSPHFLDLDKLTYQRFNEIQLSEKEYELTEGRAEILEPIIKALGEIAELLYVPENAAGDLPTDEVRIRNMLAAKLTYKRALYMVRVDRFCNAALTAIYAVDYLKDTLPEGPERPTWMVQSAKTVSVGLLEETLNSYMVPGKYVSSDCHSSCGYCQDPLSTVAKYCADALEDMGAPDAVVREIWTTAAAMLGAYAKNLGADIERMDFKDKVPRKAMIAYKIILFNKKTDLPGVLPLVDYYCQKLRTCQVNYFTSQYDCSSESYYYYT